MGQATFKLTYGTMYNPPPELPLRFGEALEKVKSGSGKEYPMLIDGKEHTCKEKFTSTSPIDTNNVLGVFQKGGVKEAEMCLAAARKAFPAWRQTPWQKRVAILRKAADLIDERLFEIAASVSLEVGKNRMEALGDIAEAADFIRYNSDLMEKNDGYVVQMESDPIPGFQYSNTSTLAPHGVWLVISPFNFPGALSYGPAGAALLTGNTVILKPATDTPWTPYLIAECLREAGLPDGVFNYGTGPGSTFGQALIESLEVDGVTFTGSYEVGMAIYRVMANKGRWIRPAVMELGGKNAAIVTRHGDVERAALGITRSAFGLQGQKCSACSRVLAEEEIYDRLVERVVELTNKMTIGDPTDPTNFLGPVINQSSYRDYQKFCADLAKAGKILTGGKVLTEGALGRGYFCTPTVAVDVPYDHYLWKQEMFLPVTMIGRVKNQEEAMARANEVTYGLTAGFYGKPEDIGWFFDRIEAGVNYVNRPHGATTGAWPAYQPFGGWKGSGATGKNTGGIYYLQSYMREKVLTTVA